MWIRRKQSSENHEMSPSTLSSLSTVTSARREENSFVNITFRERTKRFWATNTIHFRTDYAREKQHVPGTRHLYVSEPTNGSIPARFRPSSTVAWFRFFLDCGEHFVTRQFKKIFPNFNTLGFIKKIISYNILRLMTVRNSKLTR